MDKATRQYLLGKPEAECDFPFGPDVEVYKVKEKMFATLGYEDGLARINLKCEPGEALILRDMFDSVQPGYHMNKKHWNTVLLDGSVPIKEVERQIDKSYALVVKKLPKTVRGSLELRFDKAELYR